MKRIILPFLSFILLATIALAQSPQAINYQAVARDNSGNLLTNKTIAIKISILTGSSSGTVEYSETFSSASTNGFGVFSLQIGTGNVVSGTFNTIKWESANHYLKVEMDASGGSSYTTMGTSQLVSVPYAMFANKSGSTDLSKSKLGDIGDVKGTFYKGQVLKWDGTNWSAANDSIGTGTGTGGGGVSALNDLTDVKAYPKKSQILKWNGSKWVAGNDSLGATQLNELSDVSASPKKGQVLKYNGTLWVAAGDTGAQQLNDVFAAAVTK